MTFPFGQYIHNASSADDDIYDEITIDVGEGNRIDRIGFQSLPYAKFKINNEVFYMGRSGLFEAEVPVNSLHVQKNKNFILDYHYKEIGGQNV